MSLLQQFAGGLLLTGKHDTVEAQSPGEFQDSTDACKVHAGPRRI